MARKLWFVDFLPRADKGATVEDHALELAFAIQRFRNCELLKDQQELRGTPEYSVLCRTWKNFVEDFPEAQLTQDMM